MMMASEENEKSDFEDDGYSNPRSDIDMRRMPQPFDSFMFAKANSMAVKETNGCIFVTTQHPPSFAL